MINWLAATIDGNEERGKMISDMQKAASHGEGITWVFTWDLILYFVSRSCANLGYASTPGYLMFL